MVTVPRTKPIEPTQRAYDRNRSVGLALKAAYDSRQHEKGVTRLAPVQTKIWNKKARRWHYAANVDLRDTKGKRVGGRFTTAPEELRLKRKKK